MQLLNAKLCLMLLQAVINQRLERGTVEEAIAPADDSAIHVRRPEDWVADPERRAKAGVPEEVRFATKTLIALQQLRTLLDEGAPRHCVLADAGFGVDNSFRQALSVSSVLRDQPCCSVCVAFQARSCMLFNCVSKVTIAR